jgi:shikimate kinase
VNNRRIVITGFMASGKSSLASALAQRLACDAVDLDDEITRTYGRSPGEIISQDGESEFRALESESLRRVLEKGSRVIALGGGAWTIAENRELIAEFDCFTVWLDVPFEICWKRIGEAGVHRPLALDREAAERRFEARRSLYSLADLRLEAGDSSSPEGLAAVVEKTIGRSK